MHRDGRTMAGAGQRSAFRFEHRHPLGKSEPGLAGFGEDRGAQARGIGTKRTPAGSSASFDIPLDTAVGTDAGAGGSLADLVALGAHADTAQEGTSVPRADTFGALDTGGSGLAEGGGERQPACATFPKSVGFDPHGGGMRSSSLKRRFRPFGTPGAVRALTIASR
jgi:hypothetical protein